MTSSSSQHDKPDAAVEGIVTSTEKRVASKNTPDASSVTFMSDIFADEDLAWVLYQGTFRMQLRYVDAKLQKAISNQIESTASRRQRRRSAQNPQSLYTNEASAEAYGELVVANWDGLHVGTKKDPVEVPFTTEQAVRLLKRNIDALNWVSDQSADPANFIGNDNLEMQEKK